MRPAKDFLEKEYPILNERLCNRLMRGSVVGVMEEYARQIQVEAIRHAADRADNGSDDTIENNRENILSLLDELK